MEDEYKVEDGRLIINAALGSGQVSASGKSLTMLSTRGAITIAGDDGQQYQLNMTLYKKAR